MAFQMNFIIFAHKSKNDSGNITDNSRRNTDGGGYLSLHPSLCAFGDCFLWRLVALAVERSG